jgi:hypothetical protein
MSREAVKKNATLEQRIVLFFRPQTDTYTTLASEFYISFEIIMHSSFGTLAIHRKDCKLQSLIFIFHLIHFAGSEDFFAEHVVGIGLVFFPFGGSTHKNEL